MVEGTKNVDADEFVNSILNSQNDPGTRLDSGSYKESPKVEITIVVQPMNVTEEEDKLADDDYELRRRVKGKHVEESRNTPSPTPIRSPRIHSTLMSLDTEKLKEFTSFFDELKGRYRYLFGHLKTAFMPRKSFHELANHRQAVMQESLPSMLKVAQKVADAIQKERENLRAEITWQINNVISNHIPSQDDHHDDAHPEGENSAKKQKISEHGTYVIGESSSGQANENDDELPAEKVSQELVKEMSETVDDAKLPKVVDEICQRDPKAPALSLVNQDLLYLNKGNSGSKKYVLSLHKFPVGIFPNDDIEERTSRWVDKCVKKFNPYARYSVEHGKNPHAKIYYIKRQKEPGKPIEEVYLNSKIVQVINTTCELGHEHKFVTEIIVRRANERISSIIEPDYKKLNKNDIEDMYLLCVNGKVDDYAETGLLWSLTTRKKFIVMGLHKFCDATLKRVLEGLNSYNDDVKHGYMKPSLSNDDAEYLRLFKEDFEEQLKHRDQMRRWEMYVNGRPMDRPVYSTLKGRLLGS
ncbi:hypothetical protein Tco_0072724 [Tanacetum coccineum]